MELEVTWNRTIRVWWSYVWRSIIFFLVGFVIAAIVGGVIGFLAAVAGVPRQYSIFFNVTSGFIIGLATSVVPLKLIIGKDYGEFRLILLSKESSL